MGEGKLGRKTGVGERDRDRDRGKERERDRQTETDRDTGWERYKKRDRSLRNRER